MRLFATALLALTLSAIGATGALANCSGNETRIRIASWFDADDFARFRAVGLLASAINRDMNGRACAQVLTERAALEGALGVTALQAGSVELFAPRLAALSTFHPPYGAFQMPFAFRDLAAAERYQVAQANGLATALRGKELEPLAFWHGTFAQIVSRKDVYLPADLAGTRMLTSSADTVAQEIDLLKAIPQTLGENDILPAIQAGRLDALAMGWKDMTDSGIAKALGHVTETNHRYTGYQLLAGRKWWTGLRPALRNELSALIARITVQANFETARREDGARRAVMRAGVPVNALTHHQRQRWIAALAPVRDDTAEAGLAAANSGL